jgi:hypothetical protein
MTTTEKFTSLPVDAALMRNCDPLRVWCKSPYNIDKGSRREVGEMSEYLHQQFMNELEELLRRYEVRNVMLSGVMEKADRYLLAFGVDGSIEGIKGIAIGIKLLLLEMESVELATDVSGLLLGAIFAAQAERAFGGNFTSEVPHSRNFMDNLAN